MATDAPPPSPDRVDIAAPHEIRMLMDKEGNEAKAKRACQQKEWQKLIFYYYADH